MSHKANHSLGGKKLCGYYLSRAKARKANITLMPYNYIIDKKIRTNSKIETSNKIIIVDEAHNMEAVSEESSSHYLSRRIIKSAREELAEAKEKFEKEEDSIDLQITPRKIKTIIDGKSNLNALRQTSSCHSRSPINLPRQSKFEQP